MNVPWIIEEPTKIKHDLLKQYIAVWMKILFSASKNYGKSQLVTYFDGFCGPGEYYCDTTKTSKCAGSPVLVANIANDLIVDDKQRKVVIFCIDKDKECVKSLRNILNRINTNNQYWQVHQGDFEQRINAILDEIDTNAIKNYPMFFFVDPFGYSGFSMQTLKRILSYPRSEIFINYMVYDVVRFWEQGHAEQSMLDLFGTDEYKDVEKTQNAEQRQLFFINLYCKNLQKIGKSKYVMPFRINTPGQGIRPRYYLIHASQHFKALEVMKDNMARVSDVEYRFEAIGVKTAQMSLFEDPERINLRNRIKDYCKEQETIVYDDIEEWAYVNTNGIKKTIKEALMRLENEGLIEMQRKPKQRNNTVTKGALIKFIGV